MIVPAVNRVEPVVAVDAEAEEELADGEAGTGRLGGGDEVNEDAVARQAQVVETMSTRVQKTWTASVWLPSESE